MAWQRCEGQRGNIAGSLVPQIHVVESLFTRRGSRLGFGSNGGHKRRKTLR